MAAAHTAPRFNWLLPLLLLVAVCAQSASARTLKTRSKWGLCAYGKAKNYVSCCRWKSYHDRYDPSCPWRGRSCANVPWRYWKACCAGKKSVGIRDGACRPAPVGSTCGSRGPANIDACCASRNPWTDKSCSAWTTGSCSAAKPAWQDACCAQKWQGQDRWCDRRNSAYGSSCASLGPNALDACCASKDPSTDSNACWAWLPRGDCSTVADQYRPACCQNKAPGAPGCAPLPPPVGTTCGSRGPANHDECCYELEDPSYDPSCSAWTDSGSCGSVSRNDLQMACCLTKADGQDPACDSILGSQPGLLATSAPPEDDSQPTSDALETMTDSPTDVDPQQEEQQPEQPQQQSPVVDPLGPTEPEQPEQQEQQEQPRGHKSPANKPQPETSPDASPDMPTAPETSPEDPDAPEDQLVEEEPEP